MNSRGKCSECPVARYAGFEAVEAVSCTVRAPRCRCMDAVVRMEASGSDRFFWRGSAMRAVQFGEGSG